MSECAGGHDDAHADGDRVYAAVKNVVVEVKYRPSHIEVPRTRWRSGVEQRGAVRSLPGTPPGVRDCR
ncbi:hypothetical protein GCM10010269_56880 [Streptomyces humidus]|uniref:Uncharacterized protein n=1 Tax=Streptomyces humidus TaxID=52259 RepID=A0A918G1D8_9ACTN|nr:hypothetical protein GCM10010269_56880 [Streptomyces humidus]